MQHIEFWQRYLFRKGQIEDEEAARERKEERDKQAAESFQWDKGYSCFLYLLLKTSRVKIKNSNISVCSKWSKGTN